MDDKNEPQIDFPGEREHSEGEVQSDEETTSVMETDPPAAASQRTPEIADTTEFPEVHRVNRTRKRVQPDETPAVTGRVPQSDPVHSERQPYDLDLEFLATLKLPRIRPDTSSYQEFTKLTAINFSYVHAGNLYYSSKLKRQTKTQRIVIPSLPPVCRKIAVCVNLNTRRRAIPR